jgi:hypothetical protein
MSWDEDPRVKAIVRYVQWRRSRENITTSRGRKFEPSGEMFGEFRVLLDGQLLTTPEFDSAWLELRRDAHSASVVVTEGVLSEVRKDVAALLKTVPDPELESISEDVERAMASAGG